MHSKSLIAFVTLSLLSLASAVLPSGSNAVTKTFHPKVMYEIYGDGVEVPSVGNKRDVATKNIAVSFVQSKLGLKNNEVVYRSGFSSDIVDHAYFKQAYNNITIVNAVANVAMKQGRVVAFGSSFVPTDKVASSTPSIPLSSAISIAQKSLEGKYNNHPTTLEYFAKQDGSIALVHVMQIRNQTKGTWYQAHVDAHSGDLVSATDFVAQDSYTAVNTDMKLVSAGGIGIAERKNEKISLITQSSSLLNSLFPLSNEPNISRRFLLAVEEFRNDRVPRVAEFLITYSIRKQSILDGQSIQSNPQNYRASPQGWVIPDRVFSPLNQTFGNNVYTRDYALGTPTAATSNGNDFNYAYNTNLHPFEGTNYEAASVNAFYVMNSMHDFTYLYGFTERAFNFQTNNFGKGGSQADPVIVSVQDENLINNADFATPPDGQTGYCRMFLFDTSDVPRDSDMDNSVLIHEMTHGISNRLTGGGSADCLGTTVSRGLGEGWSDMMANWVDQNSPATHDFTIGRYSYNNPGGFRAYPYSTNPTVNPLRFSNLDNFNQPHSIGQIWANILHNVYAVLVEKYGYSGTAMTDPSSRHGNVRFMYLFIDAFSIQPCEPTFTLARNAFIQADRNRYNGESVCLLWKAFASRGLGTDAGDTVGNYRDGSAVPAECERSS